MTLKACRNVRLASEAVLFLEQFLERLKMILKPYWKISVLKKNLTGIELLFSEQEERVPILFLQ